MNTQCSLGGTSIVLTIFGYKRIASVRMSFSGSQQTVINYVNNNIVNKGNVVIGDVPSFNEDAGITLAFSFRLTYNDCNNLDNNGNAPIFLVWCSNPSNSSIFISYNRKSSVSLQPNPYGEGIIFIKKSA